MRQSPMQDAKFAHLGNTRNPLIEPGISQHQTNGQHREPVKCIPHFHAILFLRPCVSMPQLGLGLPSCPFLFRFSK
jgi:hypothetical protein